jgi:hypothetical protein
MSAQGDLQELLRMFTARKVSMMASMGYIKTLQAKNLKRYVLEVSLVTINCLLTAAMDSIDQIAEAPLSDIEEALKDAKLAKSFHTACKTHGKKATKRTAENATSPASKKAKLEPNKRDLDYASMTPEELEGSLMLPLVDDEELIRNTTIFTNRAPLVLAFAVEILRYTMPEQPPSSRLSLAQAVVSANSKSKAVSFGIDKQGPEMQISEGQPKVRVLGREIPVLKRGDYTWKETAEAPESSTEPVQQPEQKPKTWTASQKITSRASTFIGHAAPVSSAAQRANLIKQLMTEKPELETATHNAWAIRTSYGNSPLKQEASFDDGEGGCGKFMLELMREADITNMVVVLTRWYGGVMLGPDRWRIMRECINDAISSQRRTSSFSGEAVWGLDTQDTKPAATTVGMAIHRPEGARNYLLRSFATAMSGSGGEGEAKKTLTAANQEKQENLGRLLGALRILFDSWASVLHKDELDRRAWSWYVAVRPDVEAGPSGWGAKGTLELSRILDLKRKESG